MPLALTIISIIIFTSIALFFIIFIIFSVIPIIRGAPYVPTRTDRLKKALKLAKVGPGKNVLDLGSGDGKIIIACSKKGAKAHGIEINPFLVFKTRSKIMKENLEKLVSVRWGSFWSEDFSKYDIIFIYGMRHIMRGLEEKLQKELKPGAKVISFVFTFPNWEHKIKDGKIYMYEKGRSKKRKT